MTADRPARRAIDWQEAYARLASTARALESAGAVSPEEAGRVLRDRARALARTEDDAPASVEALELLVFSLGGERYRVETAHVREALALTELTPVPDTPAVVAGVVNHRGQILAVLDLRSLFTLPEPAGGEGRHVVALEAGGMAFGLLADAVEGIRQVGAEALAETPPATTGEGRASVRGVTPEGITVLDPEALARDPRIVVNEEVG